MGFKTCCLFLVLSSCLTLVSGHIALWHESMWGFNVTSQMFPYDNRPVAPLQQFTFDQWWFHNHLAYPPPANTFMSLPAGGKVTTELACTKSATTLFASSGGGDIQKGNDPCPGSPPTEYHTQGPDDLKGCALAITHQSDVSAVKPGDFAVFSVNHTCVWNRFTDFAVPANMPPCPEGGCICAWFWVHSADAGSEQNYMNGFRCNVTGATSTVPIATSRVPRRCGADPDFKKPDAAPWNCTYGAKQPFYWLQKEVNNMFEGEHAPPYYLDLYGFTDGAQEDIFEDSALPVFDAQGVQTGFATRGKDAATTVAVVTPTGTSWPTTTSAPTPAAVQTGGANSSASSSSSSSSLPASAATSSVPSSSASASTSSSSSAAQPTLAPGSGSGSGKQCHLRQSAFSTQGHSKRRRRHNHNKKRELWR